MQELKTEDLPTIDPAGNGTHLANGLHASTGVSAEAIADSPALVEQLTSEIDRLRHWHFWSGPLLTIAVAAVVLAFDRLIPASSPAIVLALPVLYSIFSGGFFAGLLSAAITILAINMSYPPHILVPQIESFRHMSWDITGMALVLLAGERLRRSSFRARLSDKLNRQLRYEIHERNRIERELRERKDDYEDLAENATVCVHQVGQDGTILWANQCELDTLGYTREEYVGHNIAEFHADAEVIADILARLTRDETLRDEPARMVAKDGSIRHVLINSNVRRRDGEFVHTRCFTRDVTQQHLAEKQLREQGQLFRAIADSLPVALYLTDAAGVITYYNENAAEAWGRHPVVGEDLWCGSWKIYWPDGSECPLDQCPMAIALREQRAVYGHEIEIERPDGTRIWAQPYPTPLFDGQGEFCGALNLILDISERKRTEDELRQSRAEAQRTLAKLHQMSRISKALAESRTLQEAARDVLRTVCEMSGSATASLWLRENGGLRCLDTVALIDDCDEFMEVTRSMTFKSGSGLPGRVLSSNAPAWIFDVATDPNFPRRPYAQRAGLGSAFAFPLKSGDNLNGVLEIFFLGRHEYDEAKLSNIAEAGARIGVFIERQLALDALHDSEKRFRAIFEQAGVGVVQADVDGRILDANDHYCEVLGYRREQVIGRKLLDFTHPDDRGNYVYQLGLLWAGELDRLSIEKRNLCSDGRAIWINKTMNLVRDEHGEARYTLAVVQDITTRVEAEQVIREQQDYLRAVLSDSPITLAAIDLEGTYRVFIGTAMEQIGTSAESRLGRTIYETQFKDPEAILHYERALAGETLRLRREVDGHVFEMSFAPHRDAEGEIVGAIGLASDVTEIARAEAALTQSQARLEGIVASAMDAIITIDDSEQITLFNAAAEQMFGYSAGEVLGQPLHLLLPERFRSGHSGHIKRFAQTGTTTRSMGGLTALAALRKDGTEFPIEASISQVEVAGSRLFTVILRDVSTRVAGEKALRESELRLRTALENAPLILTEIAADGTIEMIIGRGMSEAGVDPQESVGESVYERNKDNPERVELFERALQGEEINYTLTQEGLAFNTYVGPRRNAEGEITGVIGVLTNVTDVYQAQLSLHERDAALRLVTENAPIVMAHLDPDGSYRQFLGNALEDIGISASTRLGRSLRDVYPAGHPLRETFETAAAGRQCEAVVDLPGGLIYHVTAIPNFGLDGSVTDIAMLGIDMTQRISAERELERSQAFLSTVLDGAPLVLTLIDRDGIIRLSMGSSLTHKGLPVQELTGQSIHKLYGQDPEHVQLFERALAGESYRLPIRLGDVTYQVSARPYRDEKGEIAGVLSLALDITELKDVEEMLREREHQLTAILDNTPLTLATLDKEGRRTMIVGKLIQDLGIDPAPYIGKSVFESPSESPQVVEAIRSALETGEPTAFEIAALERNFHIFITPRLNEQGEIVGAMTAAMDITERVRIEQALRESEERFRTVADAAPVLIWMSGPDHAGTWFNQAWLDFTGRILEEELGDGWTAGIHPEDVSGCLEICLGKFERREPFQMIFRLRRHDGEYRRVLDSGRPLFSEAGEFMGFVGSCTDITDQQDIPSAIPLASDQLVGA